MVIENFDNNDPNLEYDILYREKQYESTFIKSALLKVISNTEEVKIKFEYANEGILLKEDILLIPETNIIFYSGRVDWCAFDISEKKVKRFEEAEWLPYIERKGNVIIIYDDLYAESTNLKAERIHKVPIDPPTETKEFDDRIEFCSPIFGWQILRLK